MSNNLNGFYILNTRPKFADANSRFAQLIESHGGLTYSLPLLEIQALDFIPPSIENFQKIIFVSQASVLCFFQHLPKPLPHSVQIIAIGKATAHAIEKHHMHVNYYAPEANSEDLLTASIFEDVKAQHVLWVKGTQGRRIIGEQLEKMGASVMELQVYQSHAIKYSKTTLENLWQESGINMVLITSEQALMHLKSLCPSTWLSSKNILCFSQRLADIAKPFIKGHILISRHDEILKTLLAFKAKNDEQTRSS